MTRGTVWWAVFVIVLIASVGLAKPSFSGVSFFKDSAEEVKQIRAPRQTFAALDGTCSQFDGNCSSCATDPLCLWCPSNDSCYDFANTTAVSECPFSLCQGDSCGCDATVWPETSGWFSQLVMIGFYGIALAIGLAFLHPLHP